MQKFYTDMGKTGKVSSILIYYSFPFFFFLTKKKREPSGYLFLSFFLFSFLFCFPEGGKYIVEASRLPNKTKQRDQVVINFQVLSWEFSKEERIKRKDKKIKILICTKDLQSPHLFFNYHILYQWFNQGSNAHHLHHFSIDSHSKLKFILISFCLSNQFKKFKLIRTTILQYITKKKKLNWYDFVFNRRIMTDYVSFV